jgi:hypothetical protein
MFNVAVRVPFALGVNSTLIVQLAPAASVPSGLHMPLPVGNGTPKSPAFAPLLVNPLKFTAELLVFVTVTLIGVLVVVSACEPNVKLVGVTVTVAVPGVPVPVSVTVCGLPVPVSVNVIAPVLVPVAVGLNVIENTHGGFSSPMLGHCASVAPAKSPLVTMLLKINGKFPLFDTVTVCAALVVPTAWLPNVSEVGAIPIATATPVPVSVTVCGLPVALSVNVIVPVRAPAAVGVNVMWKAHGVPPTAMLGHCASVAPAKSPVIEIFVNVTAVFPVFDTVNVSGELVDPNPSIPKGNGDGVIEIVPPVAAVPVPVSVTVCGLPVALSVNVIVPVRVPVAVGRNEIWNVHGVPSTAMLGHCTSVAPRKSPLVTMFVNATGVPPVFDTVTACVALVVPTAWFPNVKLVGEIDIVPVAAVPNVAVTVSSALIVTVQLGGVVCGLAGMQFPLKLVNADPVPAVAVSTTALLPANVAVQVEGQAIPAGALETVPVPAPLAVIVNPAAPIPERLTVCVLPAVGASSEIVIVPV